MLQLTCASAGSMSVVAWHAGLALGQVMLQLQLRNFQCCPAFVFSAHHLYPGCLRANTALMCYKPGQKAISGVQAVLLRPTEGGLGLKVGLATALCKAAPVIPQLFDTLPEVFPAIPCSLHSVNFKRELHFCRRCCHGAKQTWV